MKRKHSINLILSIVVAVLVILGATITYAVKYAVEEDYVAQSATNYLIVGEGDNYFESYSVLDASTEFSITVKNFYSSKTCPDEWFSTNVDFYSMDLIIYTPLGVEISFVNGYENSYQKRTVMKEGTSQDCHIIKNIPFSKGEAFGEEGDIIDRVDSKTLNLTLSGTSGAFDIDVIAVPHSEKNQFISNFYSLEKLNNQELYNSYFSNAFSDYEVVAEGDFEITDEMLIVGSPADPIGKIKLPDQSGYQKSITAKIQTQTGSIKRTITFEKFTQINFESNKTITGGEELVFIEQEPNKFFNADCGIMFELDEILSKIQFSVLPYVGYEEGQLIYFVGDVDIEHNFALNIPASLNLLYSKLNLNGDFEISHHYGGVFAIDNIGEEEKISYIQKGGEKANFSINARNSYYQTSEIDKAGIINLDTVNFSKESMNIDFKKDDVAREQLVDDAISFARSFVPKDVYNNIILPKTYHNYPITFSYDVLDQSNITKNGVVIRNADTTTENQIKIGAKFEGAFEVVKKWSEPISFNIIGTSDGAKMEYLKCLILDEVTSNTDLVGLTNSFNGSFDIGAIISNFIIKLGYDKPFFISKTSQLNLEIVYEENGSLNHFFVDDTLNFSFAKVNDKVIISMTEGDFEEQLFSFDTKTNKLTQKSTLILRTQEVVFNKQDEALTLKYGNLTTEIKIGVDVLDFENQIKFITRYLTSIYLYGDTAQNILNLKVDISESGFYVGDPTKAENKVIPSTLGVTGLDYEVFVVQKADFDKYIQNQIGMEEFLNGIDIEANITNSFSFSSGQIKATEGIAVSEGQAIILVAKFDFSSGTTAHKEIRLIKIPEKGVGDMDTSAYTDGNTFGEYFLSLNENRLLYSKANTTENGELVLGTAHMFESFHDAISLSMSTTKEQGVIDDPNISSFCNLVKSGRKWQIDIDTSKVPTENTVVTLYAKFYIEKIDDNGDKTESIISEQEYKFIIPGIFRSEHIPNATVYKAMREQYGIYLKEEDGVLVNKSFLNQEGEYEFLLVDDTKRKNINFTLTSNDFENSVQNQNVNIEGIQYLENTEKMIFNGVNILSLEQFGSFENSKIRSLTLSHCNITDAKIQALKSDNVDSHANLYYLSDLEEIDLSGNSISKLVDENNNSYLYRTVKFANFSSNNLNKIDGISKMPYLEEIDISNNQIRAFNELEFCQSLKRVDISENNATSFLSNTITCGTKGNVNIPTIIKLRYNGVEVVAKEDDGTDIELYTESERLASLVLNAISYNKTQYGATESTVQFPTQSGSYQINKAVVVSSNSDKLEIVYSVTVNGERVYKSFRFITSAT